MKYCKLILITLLLSLANSAFANNPYFFETDWGEEVRVDVIGSYSDPRYSLNASSNADPYEIFRQFVKSTLERRNYQYIYVGNCPDNFCQDPSGVGGFAQTSGASKQQDFSLNPLEIVNKIIESIAGQIGSRSVDAVVDELTKDTTAATSRFTVITSENDTPYYICKAVRNKCEIVDEATFTNFGNGQWGVSWLNHSNFPDDPERRRYLRDLESALFEFRDNHPTSFTCRITYTGTAPNLQAQMVCFPSY